MSSSTAISGINGPYVNPTTNGTTTYPIPSNTNSTGTFTIVPWNVTPTPTITTVNWPIATSTTTTYAKIYSMKLPRKGFPIKVFIDGKMLTPGLIGSRAEYTFANGKILFCGIIPYGHISLEYKDEIYHYSMELTDMGMLPALLSVVQTGP